MTDLSDSAQNHLKAIWVLQEWSDAPVTTSVIADHLGLRLSSVSDAVRKLGELGLVEHARYGSVSLTERGHGYAVAMVRRHRLIETFLVQVLHYGWDEVHEEAEVLEHAVSDLLVHRMSEVLGHPDRDPHGDPIPAPDGSVPTLEAVPLAEAAVGSTVCVERISDADAPRLEYFAGQGIVLGAELEVLAAEPYADGVRVRTVGTDRSINLGASAGQAIWVSPSADGSGRED